MNFSWNCKEKINLIVGIIQKGGGEREREREAEEIIIGIIHTDPQPTEPTLVNM